MSRRTVLLAILVAVSARGAAAPFEDEPVVRAMKDELARAVDKLELPGVGKPYYVSYHLYETQYAHVLAELGSLVTSSITPRRTLDIDLRVGDHSFDNSNFGSYEHIRSITLPEEADYAVARRAMWLATDREFKHAAETLERKRAVAKAETKNPDAADSFSVEPPSHIVDTRTLPALDLARLETMAKHVSAPLRENHDAYRGMITIQAGTGREVFISSEGSSSTQTVSYVRVHFTCETRAEDGMLLRRERNWFAASVDELPPEAEMIAEVTKISRELSALRKAPLADDYAGPILFEGIAGAQLMRVLLAEEFSGTPAAKGDRPGARGFGESELVGKIGQRILPAGFSVVDDPTQRVRGKTALAGAQHFDGEGMPSQKVSLVEDGIFKRFLMSRIPRKGFEHTNGHGQATPYAAMRAHPANLIFATKKGLSEAELRKRALAAAKDQGLKYVLVVDELDFAAARDDGDGPSFATEAPLPKPAILKRLYLDGHEEVIRGATFGGVPLRSLKDLLAAGTTQTVYDYYGSGMTSRFAQLVDSGQGMFVSIVSPSLLFRDLDVKKPLGPHAKPPIAPRP